jgi:hypothetical protein
MGKNGEAVSTQKNGPMGSEERAQEIRHASQAFAENARIANWLILIRALVRSSNRVSIRRDPL